MAVQVLADIRVHARNDPERIRLLVDWAAQVGAFGALLPTGAWRFEVLRLQDLRSRIRCYADVSDPVTLSEAVEEADGFFLDDEPASDADWVRTVLATKKPAVLSTAFLSEKEIETCKRAAQPGQVTLLYRAFTSGRAPLIKPVERLRAFGCAGGYTDEEININGAVLAVGFGADLILKRLTLDRIREDSPGGPHGLNPSEFRDLVDKVRWAEAARQEAGGVAPWLSPERLEQAPALVAARRIAAGSKLNAEDFKTRSPLIGVSPSMKSRLLGKRVLYDLEPNDPITLGVVEL